MKISASCPSVRMWYSMMVFLAICSRRKAIRVAICFMHFEEALLSARSTADLLSQKIRFGGLRQGLRFNVHTLFTHLVLTPRSGGVHLY